MYLPPAFADKDLLQARAIIREHPFASLVSNDDEGFSFVSHLPLHLVGQPEPWCLLGHCAKGNPHGRFLRERPQSLATFLGPHAYLSPAVYPDLAREPTRNYLDAHRVQAQTQPAPSRGTRDHMQGLPAGEHANEQALAQWMDESHDQGGLICGCC